MILAFVLYASFLLGIVWISYKKHTTESDFVLGSRSLNFYVTAISAHASDMSSWLFMAFPSVIYLGGGSEAWIAVGLVIGMFLNWHYVAPKLRVMTEKSHSLTLSTYLERRYKDESGSIRILTGLICILFFTFYVTSNLVALGLVFDTVFQIPYHVGVALGVLIAVLYTIFGGYITVAWTDLFQGLFLIVMIVIVPIVAIVKMGGSSSIVQAAASRNISLHFFPQDGFSGWLKVVFFVLGWGPGYFGQPHILTKFMGLKNPEDMPKSKYFGMSWQILALAAAAFIGIISIGFFKSGIANPELVFITMTKALFYPFFAGLVLCAILAASISTMETQILVQASILSEDFYKRFFRKKANTKELLWVSRGAVLLVAAVGFFIAFFKVSTIYNLVMYSWSGLGASFGPIILLSLYSKKIRKEGAVAAILSGCIVSALWNHVNTLLKVQVPELIPAFLVSLGTAYLFSYIPKRKRTIGHVES